MKEKIIEEIKTFLSEDWDIPKEKILPTSNFSSDLGIDSLEMMEIVFRIEDQYGLNLTCTPAEVTSVEVLAEIIIKHLDNNKSVV